LLMRAVERVCERGIVTRDLGGDRGTEEVASAMCEEIERVGKRSGN
jgi:isocitrate/isopropylmalate dehydrogenase